MIHKPSGQGSNLFFLEFMIALFFFLIVSTVSVRIFVSSYLTTQSSSALNQSQQLVSNLAALAEESEDLKEALYSLYPSLSLKETDCGFDSFVFLDDSFSACEENKAAYILNISVSETEGNTEAGFCVSDFSNEASSEIYKLSVLVHHPLKRKEVVND